MPPSQFTTADHTLTGAVDGQNRNYAFTSAPAAAEVLPFLNGILMTQPLDAQTTGDALVMSPLQLPHTGDTVTVRAFIPDAIGLNAPAQFSTLDGSIAGTVGGANAVFTLSIPMTLLGNGTFILVTNIMLWWNGDFLTPGVDYAFTSPTITLRVAPSTGDIVTAMVFFQ